MALILDGTSPTGAWSMYRDLLTSFVGGTRYTVVTGVSALNDQTGNGRHFTQAIDVWRPLVATAGPNSRACADFDGVNYIIETTALSNFIAAGSGYMVISFIADAITSSQTNIYDNHAVLVDVGGFMGLYMKSPTTLAAFNWDGTADTATTTIATATLYVVEWRHEGGNVTVRTNGGTEVSAASGNTTNLTNALRIGFRGAAPTGANIKVFELATYSTVPALATRNAIVADFMAQHVAATGSSVNVRGASSWGCKPLKVWSGSAWVAKPLKVWSGSAWVMKTCVTTPTDPYFSNVVLLIGADGTDGSTVFTDESSVHRTLTTIGNTQIDTAQFKFGGSSMLLDGNGDAVTAADNAAWHFGTGQFTLEAWVRFNVYDTSMTIAAQWGGTSAWAWFQDVNTLMFRAYDTAGTFRDAAPYTWSTGTTGTWYHLAFDRDASGVARAYINGAMVSKTTGYNYDLRDGSAALSVGQLPGFSPTYDLNGWIDELRITKGVARYASDAGFAVPTAAFPRS